MRRSISPLLIVFAILAAGVVGLAVGRSNGPLPAWLSAVLPAAVKPSPAEPAATGPIVYYRDPDGLPNYSQTARKTSSGKIPCIESDDAKAGPDRPSIGCPLLSKDGMF